MMDIYVYNELMSIWCRINHNKPGQCKMFSSFDVFCSTRNWYVLVRLSLYQNTDSTVKFQWIVCMLGFVARQAKITSTVGSILAELKAIEMAMGHCQNNQQHEKKSTYTDSLCALQVLQKLLQSNKIELNNKILSQIQALRRHDIHFHWIPSHAGIYYNEIADRIYDKTDFTGEPTYSRSGAVPEMTSLNNHVFNADKYIPMM